MGNTIARSKLRCPTCGGPMGARSAHCWDCHQAAKRAAPRVGSHARDACECGATKVKEARQCHKCRLKSHQTRNARAKLARTQEYTQPADGHYHFFRLASPSGATQEKACISNKKLKIKGCGLVKLHSNVIELAGGFSDFSMEGNHSQLEGRVELFQAVAITGLYP